MRLLYTFSIHLYHIAIQIAALFNHKAKLWVKGRKNIFEHLKSLNPKSSNPQSANTIAWFHCASLGEFEQGRPLIEKYKLKHPEAKIILTFFSPSGYEIRKNYSGADQILYLPIDSPSNAKQFIEILKPSVAFFVKYEFWFNYLDVLKQKGIPTYLVSGIFRPDQHFFKGYGTWFRKQLQCFDHFFVQNESSMELLQGIGYKNVSVTGDTRFDRVMEVVNTKKSIPLIEAFKDGKNILILGSSWEEDEKLVSGIGYQESGMKLIIAPHEVNESRIKNLIITLSHYHTVTFSQATESSIKDAQILIIDNIGILSSLYQYGSIAFIGGGFGKGIHNILEAATFGLPVIFGPNYEKFNEANELIRLGGAFSVSGKEEFERTMDMLKDKQVVQMASMICKNYVKSRAGATDKILSSI